MERVRNFLKKINISGEIRENEPLRLHTTFKVGGPADLFIRPRTAEEFVAVLKAAREETLPFFILGGGANLLVSDRGIRGVTVDTSRLAELRVEAGTLFAGAGLPVSAASEKAAEESLAGLEFIYAMPGSVGGALWMNARCYDFSVSDVLASVRYLDENLEERLLRREDPLFQTGFAYKVSPFQPRAWTILEAGFRLRPGAKAELWERMNEIKRDRTEKGHFLAPSAGSVFKNNRAFGAPSGAIIDRLGLRGFTLGGAQVSPRHANIIYNTGNATAADIKNLVEHVRGRVLQATGFSLEPEILFVGDWS